MTTYKIGTSGWHYKHWRGPLYPEDLPTDRWLSFYAERFDTVELNASFYRLPTETAFAVWRDSTPPGFVFAVKGSRLITHYRRLQDVAEPLANFLTRARILGSKLGPVLWQLPPSMEWDLDLLGGFLAQLPSDLCHAVEFRHPSWYDHRVFSSLRRFNAALCIEDMPGLESPVLATADFAYVRFHGSQARYASRYTEEELRTWGHRLRALGEEAKTVYAYFNNDAQGFAVANALELAELVRHLTP